MDSSAAPQSLGDLAERIAQKMDTEVSAPVQEATAIAEEAVLQDDNKLFSKIRFSWKAEDRAILERIRMSGDAMFEQAFTEAIESIDWFYTQLRVPKVDASGVNVKDADGRLVWETDELGKPIERWSQMTGDDVEKTLVDLERIRFVVAPQVNQLFLEALMARHIAQDTHDETWAGMMDGTVQDKTSKANRTSRVDRYHAYFRFYLYSTAKTFLDEIDAFVKLLNNIRYWQTRSQK